MIKFMWNFKGCRTGETVLKKKKRDKVELTALNLKTYCRGFPGGPVIENPPCNVGDVSSIPDPGRPPTCCGATKPSPHNY